MRHPNSIMSYQWSYKADQPGNVISRIYAMKWNTAKPTYDWMVQLTAGPEIAYSKQMLELYDLTPSDRAAIAACEQNRMTLAKKVQEVDDNSNCFNCWSMFSWT